MFQKSLTFEAGIWAFMILLDKAFFVNKAWSIMTRCHVIRAAVFTIEAFVIALALILSF